MYVCSYVCTLCINIFILVAMIRQCFGLKLKNVLYCTTRNIVKRTHKVPTQTEEKLKLKDNIPNAFELIYRAPMQSYLKWTKNVAIGSTVLIVLFGSWQWSTNTMAAAPIENGPFGMVLAKNDIWYFLSGFAVVNIFISMFISRYPLRIYRNIDKYLAVYESHLPLRTVIHQFQRGDVAELTHWLNPWSSISYRLGQRSSLLLSNYFKTPAEFTQMCGLT